MYELGYQYIEIVYYEKENKYVKNFREKLDSVCETLVVLNTYHFPYYINCICI